MRASIAITGIGASSALGRGIAALREALYAGRDGIRTVTRFDVAPFAPVHLGGSVPEGDSCETWAIEAAREAFADARAHDRFAPERIAVVIGTTEGEGGAMPGVARAIAGAMGARGPQWTVSTACSSSANAIGLGCDLIARGDADLVLAGGAERLVPEMYAGFFRLGVLATDKCAPFGETRGTNLGEGAGILVLERAGGSRTPWAYVNGYGLSSDAWHETSPEPRGEGIARAIRFCLDDAGLSASDIGYVNAHATGTAANDDSEWRGIRSVFGPLADRLPVSGSKSYFGHAQGAAGVLETIATLITMRDGAIPPTLRVGKGRPNGPPDPVAGETPRAHELAYALSNSSAFAGANAVVCIGRNASRTRVEHRAVRLAGVGVVTSDAPSRELDVDLRNTDPGSRMALAASARALSDAGIRVRGDLRERVGIFGGARRLSRASVAEYRASIERGGLAAASAPAFARLVLHAPFGAVSRLFALRGPLTTLADDRIAGLLAVAYAVDHLESRRDADLLLACGLDERSADEEIEEGAACLVLSTIGQGPRVAGVATAGPGALDQAIDAALERASGSRASVDAWHRGSETWTAPCMQSAALVIEARRAIGEGARVALAAAESESASCAIVVTRE